MHYTTFNLCISFTIYHNLFPACPGTRHALFPVVIYRLWFRFGCLGYIYVADIMGTIPGTLVTRDVPVANG